MYKAIGVRDVDASLKVVGQEEEEPKDPAVENSEALENVTLKAFQGQNHKAHIMAHLVFGSAPILAQLPAVAMSLQKHIMEHVSIQSKELVAVQMISQLEGQAPTEEQGLEIESMVAEFIAQGMKEVKAMGNEISGEGAGPDPLIALKQQDLEMRAKQDAAENQVDQARLALDTQKAQANTNLGMERIQSQEGIVEARIQAAREREMIKQRNQ